MIRVLLAEDEHLIREAMGALLALEPDLDVVAQASSGPEAVAAARTHQPNVAVLDLQIPGYDAITAAKEILRDVTECTVLIVTSHGIPGHLKRALEAGVAGFVPKTTSAAKLGDAIRAVHAGERYIDASLAADAIATGDSPLTARETDVLSYAGDGAPVTEIADRASLAPGTVRNYLSSALTKLGVGNRHEAVHLARARGWI
ncbi:response regulator transcription factor [Lipingzhangella sp. LS1_29]|uniref:Response regulator transcription factor n=1 Tax=Lipingzhangella rawalii TaxID=2055835 RepID=A0ABU2HAC2_9ACTN|nr:response regulator transcription factor [Lipingzhangella rawalii]MDS1272276.1 response regulator transcription factor [Lipingzhangella rawalii]